MLALRYPMECALVGDAQDVILGDAAAGACPDQITDCNAMFLGEPPRYRGDEDAAVARRDLNVGHAGGEYVIFHNPAIRPTARERRDVQANGTGAHPRSRRREPSPTTGSGITS